MEGWSSDGKEIFLKDGFDIWELGLGTGKSPVNMTTGYGRAHYTKLHFLRQNSSKPVDVKYPMLLEAFDTATKDQGFYSLSSSQGNPDKLSMGGFRYDEIIKADRAGRWIVKRENASESPNFFFSGDLRSFRALTDEH